ncbi:MULTISPECIES: TetR/AcrR family transcriptional regulator [unclassified Leucobacter]|uniref:TetR/AcrR family transcriptional regulator n=1 Tax=unclassified Leucobacter TaxID=2621730 RepID=UPI00165E6B48|nr:MULTISPECIES: TetR/AcrR family transcriptional regulator [unclassified Leucobacter]MBC9936072.1 TetR family transcriptional regulator [Leucobacter sp. cx-87]
MPLPPSKLELQREQRKIETRARILAASDTLFTTRGYEHTSVDDIAEAAGIAKRTVYLHFASKAAILLAYFDDWLDAFTDLFLLRPVDEPVLESTRVTTLSMAQNGWIDAAESQGEVNPFVEHLVAGSPEIAGHVFQSWIRAQGRIAEDYARRIAVPVNSPLPAARALSVFLVWHSSVLAARDPALTEHARSGAFGMDVFAVIAHGEI